MTSDGPLDTAWLNDRSEFGFNFVHGPRNPNGLHLEYRLEGDRVVTEWTASEEHAGFPGIVHGGLVGAVLDDAMGRWAALRRRWVLTGRIDIRYRGAAPIGVPLRIEGWTTRFLRRAVHAEARAALPDGSIVAEATGTYLPVPPEARRQMVTAWPGMAAYLPGEPRGDTSGVPATEHE